MYMKGCELQGGQDDMFYYKEELINKIEVDKPDPASAKVLQETLGGQFGEM
ncbi:Manganese containing catalase [compost metagenome]